MGEFDLDRGTTHKVRADWFRERACYPNRETYPPDLDRERPVNGPAWTENGPLDIGGRITSLAIDPRERDHFFAGSAGGGVWETRDAGMSWNHAWSDWARSLIIGSLALDPSNPDILYAGTGEANLSGDNYPGCGLYRSLDGAKTWTLAADAEDRDEPLPNGQAGSSHFFGVPRRIGTIAVDPFDPRHIFVGGVTHSEDESGGLYETSDGGATWNPASNANNPEKGPSGGGVFISCLNYFCHCVVFHPTVRSLVLAAVEARGALSGIWISEDGGQSWSHAAQGLPPGDQFGRTSIAVTPGFNTIWALAGQQGTQKLLGVFRSDDLGANWRRCTDGGFAADGQLSYTNCLATDPTNPEIAVVGSLDLFMTADGGNSWRRISDGKLRSLSAHNDHHAVALRGARVYSGNDGGFALSEDVGKTWQTRNAGLASTQVYALAVAPSNCHAMAVGTQDNGVWARGLPKLGQTAVEPSDNFRRVVTGDGGFIRYDPLDETRLYASIQRMEIWRHQTPRGFRPVLQAGDGKEVPDTERRLVWQCVLEIDPGPTGTEGTARAVYAGSNRLWRSRNEGLNWEPISDDFDGSILSALEVAQADPRCIYVGTTNGGFFRSRDAGVTWTRNLAGPDSPGRMITSIETFAENPLAVCYTVGLVASTCLPGTPFSQRSARLRRGFGYLRQIGDQQVLLDFIHLYHSSDGGDTWSALDDNLPNLPANAVAAAPGGMLFVAHDGGVALIREGAVVDLSCNLPNVRVTDLVYHAPLRWLYASTYGRGVWRIALGDIDGWMVPQPAPANSRLYDSTTVR